MLVLRLRRWANIKPALVLCLVFTGIGSSALAHVLRRIHTVSKSSEMTGRLYR